ncbi:PREDICTED: uncharacterized protein LOC108363169 isoform X1 [Rhagoletis zephyria]|uniref:uncharacterized protein LOC108363169 isoform X1 n=1 Tax=Rhagoletis zephyria TaxID=28612 RepID=UPI000811380A|nr:PREDICTED: uncharacterized protein LOC108363169 isoform X1 [Rhagoletis zephyria]
MSDDRVYKDGDIVWVKLGNNWWPGEVTDVHRQPEGLLKHLKKKPYCVVKFFQEDAYEYIKSAKQIFPFQCSKKDEFIKKGTALYNAKNKFMEKFPADVEIAERLTRKAVASDLLIINDRPDSIVKAILGPTYIRRSNDYYDNEYNNGSCNTDYNNKRRSGDSVTKILNITPQRSTTTTSTATRSPEAGKPLPLPLITSNYNTNSVAASSADTNFYRCNLCNFSSQRQNVMIMHRRTHSAGGTPTAPAASTSARKPPSATITSAAKESANAIACTTTSPATSTKDTSSSFLGEDIERKYPVTLGTSAAYVPKSENNATPLNRRNAKNRQKPQLAEAESAILSAASSSRQKLRSSLRIDADVTEITLPDGIPIGAQKGELKLSDDDTTDNSSSPATEELLRICSPRKHNLEAGEIGSTSAVLNSTAEEIRQRLLADWSDGEKDEEMLDDFKEHAKRSDVPVTEGDEFRMSELTIQATVIKKDESVYAIATPINVAISNASPQTSNPNQNRIRNIPKKDRRDAVLKEFTSDYTVKSPAAIVNLESINCSSSNSSDSVVVVAVVPPNSGETIIVDDNTGTDGETEASVGEAGTNGNETAAHGLLVNDTRKDLVDTLDEINEDTLVQGEKQAKVEVEAVEYIKNVETYERVEQSDDNPIVHLKNGDEFVLVGSEVAKNEVVDTEENKQIASDEEIDGIDLKLEKEEEGKMKAHKQPAKQRGREKRQKIIRRQKTATETLATSTESEHVPMETEEPLMPMSPQRLKEEERPLTSTAAAQQQQQRTDCFEFQEEEDDSCSDALRSIADFKKKYLSPDKAQEKALADNGLPSESEKRRSTEQKDQQLAYDIEKLLEQTTAPSIVDAAIPAVVSRTHSYGSNKEELPVKGLPIKERGKRIFKSRNRSRIEEVPPLAGVGMGGVASVQIREAIEPKVEEPVVIAMTEERQENEKQQNIEEAIYEAKIEQNKVLANVEKVGVYENEQPPAIMPPTDAPIGNEKSEEVRKVVADAQIGFKEETFRTESAEDSTILRFKAVNGSLATTTVMEVVSYSSVEQKNSETEEVNGENIGSMTELQINCEQSFGEIIHADEASKGNGGASTQPDNERKAGENAEPYENHSKLQDLSDQIDNTKQRLGAEENSSEHTNLSENEVVNAAVEQQILTEVKGNATGKEDTFRQDSVIMQDTPADNENITEPNLLLAQVAVVTEAAEVRLTEPRSNLDDKEPLGEVDDSLAAALKHDIAEDQQHDSAMIGEELPQSRLTSPTDDNSSVCISEAGAEFGSPTSMLDDERLPTITGRLMTPTDALMEVIPAGSEEAKILESEIEMVGVGDVHRDGKVQNTLETALFVAGGEGGGIELMEEVPAKEGTGEQAVIVDSSQSERVEESSEVVEGKSKELMPPIGPEGHNKMEEDVKEPSVEQSNFDEQMTVAIEQATCDNTDNLAAHSVSDESDRKNLQDYEANVEELDGEKRAENDNLVSVESGETREQIQAETLTEIQALDTHDENCDHLGESGNAEELTDNSFKEQGDASNAQGELPQDVLHDAAAEEQQQAEQQENEVNAAELLNNESKVVPEELAAVIATENIDDEDSDMDDDFIESPPHEPLSGHEGDAEALSLRAKVLTKTQKRRIINKNENSNAPPETEEGKAQLETSAERLKRRSANSASVSPQRIGEFTKEVTSGKRLTRSTRQQQAKSNDYMKELDLSDLDEATTKDENEGKELTTPAHQQQRKSTKVSDVTVKVNETNEKCEAAFVEVVAATHEANEPAVTIPDVVHAEPMETTPSNEQASEVFVEETPASCIPIVKSVGSTRKRRSAAKATPRRNASGATQIDAIQESELIEQEELIQRAKCRRLESSNDESDTGIEIIQTQEEQNAADDEANSESAIDNYIEVDPAEMQVEDNADTNAQGNEGNSPLIVEEEQCIIEEVYLNDTTAPIEETVDAAVSEINSLRPQDVSNAIEYVDYASIEHQQPIEEVIVDAVNTVEATADSDTLNNLNSSPNDASAPVHQQKAAAVHDAQPQADNVCINTSPMEKVRINVDVANPLSTQIANILATKSAGGTGTKKSNLEESIPSFIIERPGQTVGSQSQHTPSSNLDFTIGEQDAVAHVQQMCPQVKITRKEKFIDEPLTTDVAQQETTGAMFDISNMPIVLGNEHFMSAQGDMQIVLTSSPDAETNLRTDGPQILQQQILQTAYRTSTQTGQQRQRKRSTNQQQQQPLQQASNANSQVLGNNKPGIIIIKAAPSDLIIQQSQPPVLQGSQQQSQAIAGGAAQQLAISPTEKTTTTTYNLGSGVTLRPIAEPKQKQQQRQQQQQQQQQNQQTSANKPKSPAAAATGGRKQAGNTITLPSSITVKQRQQKITDGITSATTTTKAAPSEQQLSQSASGSGIKTAQKRNHPTNSRRSQLQSQAVQQRRRTGTASSLAELHQQQEAVDEDAALLNRRLSYTEAHAPPPTKIPRSADNHSESTFAATAEQQLLQLQQQQRQKIQSPTTTQPPPLHPLQNRKQRHSLSQQHRRMSTKAEVTAPQEQQQKQQQQQQRLQSTQMVLLDQQQSQCLEEQQQQQQQQEQHVTAVHISELAASSSAEEIIPAEFEAVELQPSEVYTEEILAEEFEANEHTPSVIAVPSQPVPGYPDTLLLCRRVGDEWVPVVAQPFFYTGSDQQLRPIPKEVLIGRPILTPSTDKTTEFPIETDELQMVATGETYKEETGVTILIGNNYVHMEWDQFLEVMRSNDDVYNLRDENGHVFQLTRDALVALQQDANLQDKYRQLQQLLEEQQLEEQQQLEQQELLQQQFIQQLQTVTVTGEEGLEADIIPLLHIDTTQTLQLIGTDDGNLILQPTLVQPPLSPPCTRPALTNATNALLNQTPIMSPLEKPSTATATTLMADGTGQHIDLGSSTAPDHLVAAGFISDDAPSRPTLGDSLAVIGVVPTQPTLLPTTVTNPAIAPPKSDLIPNMTTAAQMHAQFRHAQRAIYNDPGS